MTPVHYGLIGTTGTLEEIRNLELAHKAEKGADPQWLQHCFKSSDHRCRIITARHQAEGHYEATVYVNVRSYRQK